MPELVQVHCPHCGEAIELVVDTSAGAAEYVEDCPVCCRPIEVDARMLPNGLDVRVRSGDE